MHKLGKGKCPMSELYQSRTEILFNPIFVFVSPLDGWSGFNLRNQWLISGIPLVSVFHEKSRCSLCFLFFAFTADFYRLCSFNASSNTFSVLMLLGFFPVLWSRSEGRPFVPKSAARTQFACLWLIDDQKLWQAAPSGFFILQYPTVDRTCQHTLSIEASNIWSTYMATELSDIFRHVGWIWDTPV